MDIENDHIAAVMTAQQAHAKKLEEIVMRAKLRLSDMQEFLDKLCVTTTAEIETVGAELISATGAISVATQVAIEQRRKEISDAVAMALGQLTGSTKES